MTTVIAITSQKGGVSKTTLSVNIAAQLANQNKKVLLIDLDKQHSSYDFVNRRSRKHPASPQISCSRSFDDVGIESYGFTIIDGPISHQLISIADIIVIPFRPSLLDLSTIPILTKLLNGRKALAVLTQCPTNSNSDAHQAKQVLKSCSSFKLCNTLIYHRKSYIDSMSGLSVAELQDHKAKQEITNLTKELTQWQNQA